MGCEDDSQRCMIHGCCCCYSAFDCGNTCECGYRKEEDCLCIRHACCISANAKSRGLGLVTNKEDENECCKIGLWCCDLGLVNPKTCCSGASSLCCIYEVVSCPCSEHYVNECVCAFCYGIACAPKCGCCVTPPECPALDKLMSNGEMQSLKMDDRGDAPVQAEAEVVVAKKDDTVADA